MFPVQATNNPTDQYIRDTIAFSQCSLGVIARRIQAANLFDLLGSKFGWAALLAYWREKVSCVNGVFNIFLLRHPFQVVKAIVGFITVFMVRHHSIRAWADKGFEHQNVDKDTLFRMIQRNSLIASPSCWLFENISRLGFESTERLTNISKAANFIEFFVSDYRFPLFHRNLRNSKRHQNILALPHDKFLMAVCQT